MTDGDHTPRDQGESAEEPLEGEIIDESFTHSTWDRRQTTGAGVRHGSGRASRDQGADGYGSWRPGSSQRRSGSIASAPVATGAALVAVGAVLLAARLNDAVAAGGPALWIGAGLLVWWALRGTFAILLPASVLLGLGLGLVLAEAAGFGNPVVYGLGAGFVAVTALALVRHGAVVWWPLIPGVALIAVGVMTEARWGGVGDLGWPLFLIVVGLLVLGLAFGRGRRR